MPDASNTRINIYNKALAKIKVAGVTSVDQQCEPARKCNLFYDCARKSLLRSCDWRFATVKKQLNLLGTIANAMLNPTNASYQDVLPQWAYTYAYPVNCVRLRKIFTPQVSGSPTPWNDKEMQSALNKIAMFEVARSPITNVLCVGTNYPEAWAEFTYDITDESQFDDMFQDALADALAADLAIPLSCDKELAQMAYQKAKASADEARRKNGGEGVEMLPRVSNYESSRAGYQEPY